MRVHVLLGASLTALFLVASAAAASAQTPAPDARKAEVIRQILEETKAADTMLAAIEVSVPAQRAANPAIPAVFWDRILETAKAQRPQLLEMLVPVYAQSFELADLEGLLAFYRSPLGRRLIATTPSIVRDSAQIGQKWGMQLGASVGEQLAKEGVQLKP